MDALVAVDWLLDLGDRAAAALGFPLRVRIAAGPSLLVGRAPRARCTVRGVMIAGLELAAVDVLGSRVRLAPAFPPRLRATGVRVRIEVNQRALDRWSRQNDLPVRLKLRDGAVVARSGVGGMRLGEVDMDLRIEGGRLRAVPRRVAVLGLDLGPGAALFRVTFPVPPLPRGVRLRDVDVRDGEATLTFLLDQLDVPVGPSEIRAMLRAGRLRQRSAR